MQGWQCPIYNDTLKSCVISSRNKIYIIHMFYVFVNCSISIVVSLKNNLRIFAYIRNNEEMIWIKYFLRRKNEGIFSIFSQIKVLFQGYCCKPGIDIFVWRITCNFANSPFNLYFRDLLPSQSPLCRHDPYLVHQRSNCCSCGKP